MMGRGWGGAYAFNELYTGFVIEVLHILPFDAFCVVFVLFSLEGEIDEDLLKLLIDVI